MVTDSQAGRPSGVRACHEVVKIADLRVAADLQKPQFSERVEMANHGIAPEPHPVGEDERESDPNAITDLPSERPAEKPVLDAVRKSGRCDLD